MKLPYIIEKNPEALYNVFIFHGNFETVKGKHYLTPLLADRCNVIQIEYPGYYKSENRLPPFEASNFMNEIESTFYDVIHSGSIPDDLTIFFIGISIGSIIAGSLARRVEGVNKMLLITPLSEIGPNLFPITDFRYLSFAFFNKIEEFDNVKMLEETNFPVLLITAERDTVIPNGNTLRLLNVRKGVQNINIDADHNNINFQNKTLTDSIRYFLFSV